MLRLNDNYGLDDRIARINEMMKAEERTLALIDKAVLVKDQEMYRSFAALNLQLDDYKRSIDGIFQKL
ncbi:hypothetical protein HNW13_017990 [Shewanella sp. BF02_Schw]|uniref:hypothetical protein n=1 Tax=Shewanella sp. BF02_Schw TaxID=394908 RepID=UPI0017801B19|nr:hypothetical protein [Shewanella sp. BF02_Schw]MBO1897631.1 hypothetical protein [Shewanella sp. BF02_Schw]